jgi:hypothetical protein
MLANANRYALEGCPIRLKPSTGAHAKPQGRADELIEIRARIASLLEIQ